MTTPLRIVMTESEARQITARINLLITSITESTEKVVALIEQAEAGQAWKALGHTSWTAYVAAEFSDALAGLGRAERIPIVEKMSSTGMSTRAIAPVVGVGKSTVDRDLEQVSRCGTPGPATGLDGKTYIRNGKPTATGMTELANAVPAVKRKAPRRPLPDAYKDAVYDLIRAMEKLQRLHTDDRFKQNRDAIKHHWGTLTKTSLLLGDLEVELRTDLYCRDCERTRVASAADDFCGNCRRRRDPNVLGPCEHCGSGLFADCTCEDGVDD